MSKAITIRDELVEKLDEMKNRANEGKTHTDKGYISYSGILKTLLEPWQEAEVSTEGRISKTLAGKKIAYKVIA